MFHYNFFKNLWIYFFLSVIVITLPNRTGKAEGSKHHDIKEATWASASKSGIGTAYQAEHQSPDSTVWFSLAKGIVTEVIYGKIHEAQTKELNFIFVGEDFVENEKDSNSKIDYLDKNSQGLPQSLSYRQNNESKQHHYRIEKDIFTDPHTHSLFLRITIEALDKKITPYLSLSPHLNARAGHDKGFSDNNRLVAYQDKTYLVLKGSQSFSSTFIYPTVIEDKLIDFRKIEKEFSQVREIKKADDLKLVAKFPTLEPGQSLHYDIVLSFGHGLDEAEKNAQQTLTQGYETTLSLYNQGWESYLASLTELENLRTITGDNGYLLNISAMILKTQEDKLNPGALIASLSTPWGETSSAKIMNTGYKAVWPRDFYQTAMAMLAMGDRQTPLSAFTYLEKIQVKPETPTNKGASGWFLQKTLVDGEIELANVQLDQTAMPIMLAWKLWHAGLIKTKQLKDHFYPSMIKPAADFLVSGGYVSISKNKVKIVPPTTQQERWEEQAGDSPSTIAAEITGLIAASDIAQAMDDSLSALKYQKTADRYYAEINHRLLTCPQKNSCYFLRLSPDGDANSHVYIKSSNGKPSLPQEKILDAGFLEFVRYGIIDPHDPRILASLEKLDTNGDDSHPEAKVRYDFTVNGSEFTFPGWRRYSYDGYGERVNDGTDWAAKPPGQAESRKSDMINPYQRGRVWPLLTGERGHYELAALLKKGYSPSTDELQSIQNSYVRAIEYFASRTGLLSEQIWDGVGVNRSNRYQLAKGTESATPLSWSHAEYIKLLRSLYDRQVWDQNSSVVEYFHKR
jgi:glucoamylase